MNVDSIEEWNSLDVNERLRKYHDSANKLVSCGADYVIHDVTHLPKVVRDINSRLSTQSKINLIEIE